MLASSSQHVESDLLQKRNPQADSAQCNHALGAIGEIALAEAELLAFVRQMVLAAEMPNG